jgi:hypothetical protein
MPRAISKDLAVLERLYRRLSGPKCNKGNVHSYHIGNLYCRFWGYGQWAGLGVVRPIEPNETLSDDIRQEYEQMANEAIELEKTIDNSVVRLNTLREKISNLLCSKGVEPKHIHKNFFVVEDYENYKTIETKLTALKEQLKPLPINKTTLPLRKSLKLQIETLKQQLRQIK